MSGGFQTQFIPQVEPEGGLAGSNLGEIGQGIRPSRWDTIMESIKLHGMDVPLGIPGVDSEGALFRMHEQSAIRQRLDEEHSQKMSIEELNKNYPGMPIPFSAPEYPAIADIQHADQMRRVRSAAWIARGPEVGALPGAIIGGLGGAAQGVLGGPVGIGIGALVGAGLGAYAGPGSAAASLDALNLALNFATVGVASKLGYAQSLKTIAAENLAITAGTEIPVYLQNRAEHQNVSLGEAATNVLISAGISTGIGAIFHSAFSALGKTPPEERIQNLKEGITQAESGQKIDMSASSEAQSARARGEARPGTVPPEYVPGAIEHPSDRTFFTSRDGNNTGIPMDQYGEGVYASDNGMVANNLGDRVTAVKVPKEAKFLDLNEPFPANIAAYVATEIEKLGIKLPEDFLKQNSGKRVIDYLTGEGATSADKHSQEIIREISQSEGYDGYRYTADMGGDNRIVMFDKAQLTPTQEYQANQDLAPRRNLPSEENFRTRRDDPAIDRVVSDTISNKIVDTTVLDPVTKASTDMALERLIQLSASDPELAQQLQDIRKMDTRNQQELQAIKDLAQCIVDDIT